MAGPDSTSQDPSVANGYGVVSYPIFFEDWLYRVS